MGEVVVQDQLEGQQIGRYLIHQRLGGGGVATVYRAYDQVSGQSVALKVLPPNPDPATLDRFRREAVMAGAVRHPHIVRILQVGTAAGGSSAYIAMELAEGESLAALLAQYGQLRPEESCLLLEPIARALAFAHSHGVIHRDVKPSNILLRPVNFRPDNHGPTLRVHLEPLQHAVIPLLSDFGIARYLDMPELTNAGRTVGTPAFMAPEQCMGSREVDRRADIYSLGTVLYRCVTGRLPFNGSTTQILHAHVFEPVVIDEGMARALPPQVVAILRQTLAKSPQDRYQAADELADHLAAAGASARDASRFAQVDGGVAHTTATMTVAQLPAAQMASGSTSTSSAVQVLVPGTTSVESAVPTAGRKQIGERRRGPNLERVLWAAFFVVLIGGGGLWSASTWFRAESRQRGVEVTLPSLVLTTFTPTPEAVASPPAQAVASAVTPTVESAMTATALPVAVPTAVPTAIAPTATAVPTATPMPVILDVPPPTEVPTTVATPAEEIVGTCAMVVDEFFLPSVAQLTGALQADFACPTAPARTAVGEWLPFARGVMVAIDGEPLIYVYYEDGTWEQARRDEGNLPPDAPGRGGEDRPILPLPFARVLGAKGRHVLLGEPLQTEPSQSETLIQPFFGGVALGNRSDGHVLLLARAKLRF